MKSIFKISSSDLKWFLGPCQSAEEDSIPGSSSGKDSCDFNYSQGGGGGLKNRFPHFISILFSPLAEEIVWCHVTYGLILVHIDAVAAVECYL